MTRYALDSQIDFALSSDVKDDDFNVEDYDSEEYLREFVDAQQERVNALDLLDLFDGLSNDDLGPLLKAIHDDDDAQTGKVLIYMLRVHIRNHIDPDEFEDFARKLFDDEPTRWREQRD